MKVTKELAIAALKPVTDLGETPDAIAKSLKRKRIKGTLEDPQSCPLAHLLADFYEVYGDTEVGQRGIVINGLSIPEKYIPKRVQQFITNFDNEKYPNLID